MGGAGDPEQIENRVNQLKGESEFTSADYDRQKLQERLAKLAGGVAVIKVGASTETELREKKHRVEDASVQPAPPSKRVSCPAVVSRSHAQEPVTELLDSLDGDERTGTRIVHCALEADKDDGNRGDRQSSWWTRCALERLCRVQRFDGRGTGHGLGEDHRPGDGDQERVARTTPSASSSADVVVAEPSEGLGAAARSDRHGYGHIDERSASSYWQDDAG